MALSSGQRETLTELSREYAHALEEQRQRNVYLAQLRTAINALVALDTNEPITFAGTLAEACRAVLKNAGRPLTPLQVREGIIALGYNLAQHKSNPLASIHAVLRRLAESGDVERAVTDGGDDRKPDVCYFWLGRAETQRLIAATSFDPATYPDLNFMSSGQDYGTIAAIHANAARQRHTAAIKASSQFNNTPAPNTDTDKER